MMTSIKLFILLIPFLCIGNPKIKLNFSSEEFQSLFVVLGEAEGNFFGTVLYKEQFLKNSNIACEIRKRHPNLLIMVDQEGGDVINIDNINLPPHPRKKYDQNEFEKKVKLAAIDLKKKCIDINLAPVMENTWRSYKHFDRIKTFSKIMQSEGIHTVLKYYPGKLGPCKNLKHLPGFNLLPKSEIETCDHLADSVWKAADEFSVDWTSMIMMSNRIYSSISPKPALFDPIYSDRLKKTFKGLIISDALWEFGITAHPSNIVSALENVDVVMLSDLSAIQTARETLIKESTNRKDNPHFYQEKFEKIKAIKKKILLSR